MWADFCDDRAPQSDPAARLDVLEKWFAFDLVGEWQTYDSEGFDEAFEFYPAGKGKCKWGSMFGMEEEEDSEYEFEWRPVGKQQLEITHFDDDGKPHRQVMTYEFEVVEDRYGHADIALCDPDKALIYGDKCTLCLSQEYIIEILSLCRPENCADLAACTRALCAPQQSRHARDELLIVLFAALECQESEPMAELESVCVAALNHHLNSKNTAEPRDVILLLAQDWGRIVESIERYPVAIAGSQDLSARRESKVMTGPIDADCAIWEVALATIKAGGSIKACNFPQAQLPTADVVNARQELA